MYWSVFLLSSLSHFLLMSVTEGLLSIFYSNDTKKRLNYAIDEVTSCIITLVYGIQMLHNPDLLVPGVWEMVMLPSYIIEMTYIVVNRKNFKSGFFRFIIFHHLLAMTVIVSMFFIEANGLFNLIPLIPYSLIWNGSTIPWFIDFAWELHRGTNYTIKLSSMMIQRVWRNSLWVYMILIGTDYPEAVIMIAITGVLFEVYDIPHQVKALSRIKAKII